MIICATETIYHIIICYMLVLIPKAIIYIYIYMVKISHILIRGLEFEF